MHLPERHQSYIKNKMRSFYLLPIVYYPRSKKWAFRWPLRSYTFPTKIRWTHYLWVNVITFLTLPYLMASNRFYFGRSGLVYEEIDYDAIYGD